MGIPAMAREKKERKMKASKEKHEPRSAMISAP